MSDKMNCEKNLQKLAGEKFMSCVLRIITRIGLYLNVPGNAENLTVKTVIILGELWKTSELRGICEFFKCFHKNKNELKKLL